MPKIDPQDFEIQRGKLVSGLLACAEQLQKTAKVVEDFAQLINGLDGEIKGKRKELVFDTDADEGEGTKKRKRATKPKDPNAPKRPPSSYILFQNEIRNELRKQFPEITNSQLLTLISEKWKSLPDDEKERYNERMRSAKARYSDEKAAYDARSPEEVEAANRALAESVALKKANRGKAKKQAAPAAAPVAPQPKSEELESDEEHAEGETDDESEEDGTPVVATKPSNKKVKPESSSSEEESASEDDDDDVDMEPEPKRTKRSGSTQPKSRKHKA